MKAHLLALNLNGMTRDGDKIDKRFCRWGRPDFHEIAARDHDSGWRGSWAFSAT
jgi:hypothetical protein